MIAKRLAKELRAASRRPDHFTVTNDEAMELAEYLSGLYRTVPSAGAIEVLGAMRRGEVKMYDVPIRISA
jgi:hypothetical protein